MQTFVIAVAKANELNPDSSYAPSPFAIQPVSGSARCRRARRHSYVRLGVAVTLDAPYAPPVPLVGETPSNERGPFDAPLAAYLRGLFRLALHHLAICEATTGALRRFMTFQN